MQGRIASCRRSPVLLLLPLADQGGDSLKRKRGDSGESGVLAGWLVAGKVVVQLGDRGRNWPGGGLKISRNGVFGLTASARTGFRPSSLLLYIILGYFRVV